MSRIYTNLYFNQPLVVLDTTQATSSSGSMVLKGGISILGNSILSDTDISGITTIKNSSQSNDTSTGSLIVKGGIAINKNMNIGGNANVHGSLTAGSFYTENIISPFGTIGSLSANNITGDLISTNTSISNATITNMVSINISSGSLTSDILYATTGTFNTVSTNLLIADTISTTNISTNNI